MLAGTMLTKLKTALKFSCGASWIFAWVFSMTWKLLGSEQQPASRSICQPAAHSSPSAPSSSQNSWPCSSSVSIGAVRHRRPSTGTQNMRNTDCSKRWFAFILEHWNYDNPNQPQTGNCYFFQKNFIFGYQCFSKYLQRCLQKIYKTLFIIFCCFHVVFILFSCYFHVIFSTTVTIVGSSVEVNSK